MLSNIAWRWSLLNILERRDHIFILWQFICSYRTIEIILHRMMLCKSWSINCRSSVPENFLEMWIVRSYPRLTPSTFQEVMQKILYFYNSQDELVFVTHTLGEERRSPLDSGAPLRNSALLLTWLHRSLFSPFPSLQSRMIKGYGSEI